MITVFLYLISIIVANLSVAHFGVTAMVVNAFILIAFDLTARDSLHEVWQGHGLRWKMTTLIATGSLLSAVLNANAAHIALASFIAFASAATIDTLVYMAMHKHSKLAKMNASNVASSAVDSLVFPLLAFGFPVLWWVVIGQFVAKVAGGLLWSLILTPYQAVNWLNEIFGGMR